MSKFDRYKKKAEVYVYPHKHCKNCGQMINEGISYCPECYQEMKDKKRKKRFWRKKTPKV
ncbi:MAG: DUF2116 family Zn-ribbon domain-containing protein [Candidatus Hodarchaeota archaeon]